MSNQHGSRKVRIGTRGSALARWQAEHVAALLRAQGADVLISEITTHGDEAHRPIALPGAEGAFTKRIQQALLEGEVDVAVHSLKDLPTAPIEGLLLAAVPKREPPEDALVTPLTDSLDALPRGARVGTGSVRRRTQLLHARPDLQVHAVRGNVDTRLAKLDAGHFDALILAAAGLCRLGLENRIAQRLPTSTMLPAAGQGALGIECRSEDQQVCGLLSQLDDAESRAGVVAERALLAKLHAGCLAPVGTWGRIAEGALLLSGVVLSNQGQTRMAAEQSASISEPERLGERVAEQLIAQGADRLIAEQRDAAVDA